MSRSRRPLAAKIHTLADAVASPVTTAYWIFDGLSTAFCSLPL